MYITIGRSVFEHYISAVEFRTKECYSSFTIYKRNKLNIVEHFITCSKL